MDEVKTVQRKVCKFPLASLFGAWELNWYLIYP